MNDKPRIRREARTVEVMIDIYCRQHRNDGDSLCSDCQELLDYAIVRLHKCPFQEGKTTCARCPVHCYKPNKREKMRDVMRYTGPRMPLSHPVITAQHYVDSLRKKPAGKK